LPITDENKRIMGNIQSIHESLQRNPHPVGSRRT
jgi:hypothetical protein